MPEKRLDPLMTYKFHVELEGIVVAGFSEATGLSIQTEVETVKEGGANDVEYKLPTRTKFSDITLKRGLSETNDLWKWYESVITGEFARKDGSIHLMDHTGTQKISWDFYSAFPVKWDGPALNAASASAAIETFTLTFQRIERRK